MGESEGKVWTQRALASSLGVGPGPEAVREGEVKRGGFGRLGVGFRALYL